MAGFRQRICQYRFLSRAFETAFFPTGPEDISWQKIWLFWLIHCQPTPTGPPRGCWRNCGLQQIGRHIRQTWTCWTSLSDGFYRRKSKQHLMLIWTPYIRSLGIGPVKCRFNPQDPPLIPPPWASRHEKKRSLNWIDGQPTAEHAITSTFRANIGFNKAWRPMHWKNVLKKKHFSPWLITPPCIPTKYANISTVGSKKSTSRKKWDTAFFITRGVLNEFFADFFCMKLLLYLSTTVRKIKNPIFWFLIHTVIFARCKKTNYFFVRNSPFTVETIFLAMRV